MFGVFTYKSVPEDATSTAEDEQFLDHFAEEKPHLKSYKSALPWMISTCGLGVCLFVVLMINYPFFTGQKRYETGFATEMQAGVHVIELEERRFWGGIKVNSNGSFYQNFNPDDQIRYVGRPTAEMDAAWDRLTGTFVALTKEESESVRGDISEYKGGYLAAFV
ncbi:MAG: hypothetical protein MMC33_007897 [Icmadophila ericetorum]|nr:hypothetical protein [Icmadophila ericetorum]